MFIQSAIDNPRYFIAVIVVVTFSICVHEFAHAWTALHQGDSTAADEGHLTLDPMKQMGTTSIIMLLLLGLAWGAVPVRPERMRHRWSHALVAFAGPASNIILAIAFTLIAAAASLSQHQLAEHVVYLFRIGGIFNIALFLLNMLPVSILDGHTVFSYFIPALRNINPGLQNAMFFGVFIGFMFFGKYFFMAGMLFTDSIIYGIQHIAHQS